MLAFALACGCSIWDIPEPLSSQEYWLMTRADVFGFKLSYYFWRFLLAWRMLPLISTVQRLSGITTPSIYQQIHPLCIPKRKTYYYPPAMAPIRRYKFTVLSSEDEASECSEEAGPRRVPRLGPIRSKRAGSIRRSAQKGVDIFIRDERVSPPSDTIIVDTSWHTRIMEKIEGHHTRPKGRLFMVHVAGKFYSAIKSIPLIF